MVMAPPRIIANASQPINSNKDTLIITLLLMDDSRENCQKKVYDRHNDLIPDCLENGDGSLPDINTKLFNLVECGCLKEHKKRYNSADDYDDSKCRHSPFCIKFFRHNIIIS